ncbi:MAG: toprim domain-containing protein [Methylophilus sp.]|uniref:toprim domain-containing protein n=1 Tax=Methylophilus sp. TaxID=29541 RepID=UPI003FA0BCB0
MNQVQDRNIFEEAKRLSLVDFLEEQFKETGRKVSKGIRFKSCPACGTSPDHFRISVLKDLSWSCFSCGKGGSIIDAASFIWCCSPKDAANSLLGISDEVRVAKIKERDPNQEPDVDEVLSSEMKGSIFKKLREALRSKIDPKTLAYLLDERMLSRNTVDLAMERGMIGMMPSDPKKCLELLKSVATREEMELAQIWKKDAKMPGIAYRPLVFFMPGAWSAEFRIIGPKKYEDQSKSVRYNVSKSPFIWRASNEGIIQNRMLVTEGAIDLLSAVDLGWKEHIMGLPGTQTYKLHGLEWFHEAKRVHDVDLFVIGFDNDLGRADGKNPGQTAAIELVDSLTGAGLPSLNHPPKTGDINDALRAKKRLRLVA